MKRSLHPTVVYLLLLVAISRGGHGSEENTAHSPVHAGAHCYGLAMVGMDSVINSRLGIRPEHILHLATTDPDSAIASHDEISAAAPYSTRLLRIIFEAYLWQGEPHEYASAVLEGCQA
ncbi:MAG: hypothetical protein IPK65_03830 [Gammaproteobacteria bacterium]|nr:hypothetical protein [Gammaproteobacteria bacterium]